MLLKVDDIVSGISGKKKDSKEPKEEKITPEEVDAEKD
jgi:hypothetical protein